MTKRFRKQNDILSLKVRVSLLVLICAILARSGDLPPELILLAHIKANARQGLNDIPAYACTESVERAMSVGHTTRMHLMDKMDFEVAEIGDHEVYARAGDHNFSGNDMRNFLSYGLTATGEFFMHARSIFLGPATKFTYKGAERHGGRKTNRFDYKVSAVFAGYEMHFNHFRAHVGVEGSFWADAATNDVIELEVRAAEIPAELKMRSAVTHIHYSRGRLDGRSFLVPIASEVVTVDADGYRSENRAAFHNCRKFQSETSITF